MEKLIGLLLIAAAFGGLFYIAREAPHFSGLGSFSANIGINAYPLLPGRQSVINGASENVKPYKTNITNQLEIR